MEYSGDEGVEAWGRFGDPGFQPVGLEGDGVLVVVVVGGDEDLGPVGEGVVLDWLSIDLDLFRVEPEGGPEVPGEIVLREPAGGLEPSAVLVGDGESPAAGPGGDLEFQWLAGVPEGLECFEVEVGEHSCSP